MIQVRERRFTREEAIKLVKRMIRKDIMNYIIRDALLDKGFSVYEANTIIREVRRENAEVQDTAISHEIVGYGLTIITFILLMMILFLLIAPAK